MINGSRWRLPTHPVDEELAHRHNKSTSQVNLRGHVQPVTVAIPKSANALRHADNLHVSSFVLCRVVMARLTAPDHGEDAAPAPDYAL